MGAPAATLYFDVGSADLPADSTGGLEPVVAYLKANPSTTAVVSGYHDPSGDAAANEELAKNRALAVQNALEGAGVEAARIDLEKPVVTTGSWLARRRTSRRGHRPLTRVARVRGLSSCGRADSALDLRVALRRWAACSPK